MVGYAKVNTPCCKYVGKYTDSGWSKTWNLLMEVIYGSSLYENEEKKKTLHKLL